MPAASSERPTTATPTSATPSRTSCSPAGHAAGRASTLPEVAAAFAAIEAASGPARESRPAAPARTSRPRYAKGIVKVLSGDLRIGLREGLLEAAIASAFDRPLDDVKWAGMLTGDIGPHRRARPRRPARRRPSWRCSSR